MRLATAFNKTMISIWINSEAGRTFRIVSGTMFLIVGVTFRDEWWGLAMLLWGLAPLTAGAFDICYISAALGGPLKGADIRDEQLYDGEPLPMSSAPSSSWPAVRDQ